MPDVCRQGERRGGAVAWPNPKENFLHADTDAAQKEEIYCCDKEIADTDANAWERNANRSRKSFANSITNAVAESEKEKGFANPNAHSFATSKEEDVAFAATVRNAFRSSKGNSVTVADARTIAFAWREKARRSQRDFVAE